MDESRIKPSKEKEDQSDTPFELVDASDEPLTLKELEKKQLSWFGKNKMEYECNSPTAWY